MTNVEIARFIPPREVQEFMKPASSPQNAPAAPSSRIHGRAKPPSTWHRVKKQSAILKAEGDKQANILKPKANARRRCCAPRATQLALDKIFEVAKTIDSQTITLQYFDTPRIWPAARPPSTSSQGIYQPVGDFMKRTEKTITGH